VSGVTPIGRTSIDPPYAAGQRVAHFTASSSCGTSMMW
jgi:hypothetical protein